MKLERVDFFVHSFQSVHYVIVPSINMLFSEVQEVFPIVSFYLPEYSLIICFEFLDTSIGQRVFYHLHQNL